MAGRFCARRPSARGAVVALASLCVWLLSLTDAPSALPAQAALLPPWTRAAAPSRLGTPRGAAEWARLGAERAREVIDAPLASVLYGDQRCFGLAVVQGVLRSSILRRMRDEAAELHKQGRLTPSGDPDEPQLSEQYKRYFGDKPTLTILEAGQAEAEGLRGLAYGSAFMCSLCDQLSALRPSDHTTLEPGTLQLACYDGGGVAYHVHEDYVPEGDYDPESLPEHHRFAFKRRVTAILYLQDDWQDGWGGAFRAHAARPDGEELSPEQYFDVQPDGGSLVLFRSDMPHEVLPTFGKRFALSMWCHATDA